MPHRRAPPESTTAILGQATFLVQMETRGTSDVFMLIAHEFPSYDWKRSEATDTSIVECNLYK